MEIFMLKQPLEEFLVWNILKIFIYDCLVFITCCLGPFLISMINVTIQTVTTFTKEEQRVILKIKTLKSNYRPMKKLKTDTMNENYSIWLVIA